MPRSQYHAQACPPCDTPADTEESSSDLASTPDLGKPNRMPHRTPGLRTPIRGQSSVSATGESPEITGVSSLRGYTGQHDERIGLYFPQRCPRTPRAESAGKIQHLPGMLDPFPYGLRAKGRAKAMARCLVGP
jgi:hypothetical protein